jgi:hypothetical protein
MAIALTRTNPVLATALALLDLSNVITIPRFSVLKQLLAKMRIAGVLRTYRENSVITIYIGQGYTGFLRIKGKLMI